MGKVWYFLGAIIIGSIVFGVVLALLSEDRSPVDPSWVVASISADSLFNAYYLDDDRGEELYDHQVVRVTGEVLEVLTDDVPTVVLAGGGTQVGAVNAQMAETVAVDDLPAPGETVSLVCACQGFMMNVWMNRCILQP